MSENGPNPVRDLGESAFTGGTATALLGVFFHLIISFAVAAVFILSADRITLLRRYAIAGSLLYGFGVFIVMHMVVTPLSAAPPVPTPTIPWLIDLARKPNSFSFGMVQLSSPQV